MSRLTPILTSEVSVVSTFIVAGVDGSIDNVGIDSSADIHFSGVGRGLGVVHVSVDVEVGGNLVVGDNSVGGHIVAAWFVLKVPLCVGSLRILLSSSPSEMDILRPVLAPSLGFAV